MGNADKITNIDGKSLRKLRESLGVSTSEIAYHTSLSKTQIEQIENGLISAFYSEKIKFNAYIKVSSFLNSQLDKTSSGVKSIVDRGAEDSLINNQVKNLQSELVLLKNELFKEKELNNKLSFENAELKKSFEQARPLDVPQLPKKTSRLIKPVFAVAGFIGLVTFAFSWNYQFDLISMANAGVQLLTFKKIAPTQVESNAGPGDDIVDLKPSNEPEKSDVACQSRGDSTFSYKHNEAPTKNGNSVFIRALKPIVVCVEDSLGKTETKSLNEAGEYIFSGSPPFKVYSANLGDLEMFFQGQRVRPINLKADLLQLDLAGI